MTGSTQARALGSVTAWMNAPALAPTPGPLSRPARSAVPGVRLALGLACAALLGACSEAPQTLGTAKDTPAYSGTTGAYAAPGWKAGDKTAWQQQLRARAQYGMNDYTRSP